ncbi:MAG: hypothetical protein ACJ76N_14320 [Thermoanaerobaculia bacterium]
MKKGVKKLRLHRETLRSLTDRSLGTAAGGVSVGTFCATECVDGCVRTDTCTQCSRVCP